MPNTFPYKSWCSLINHEGIASTWPANSEVVFTSELVCDLTSCSLRDPHLYWIEGFYQGNYHIYNIHTDGWMFGNNTNFYYPGYSTRVAGGANATYIPTGAVLMNVAAGSTDSLINISGGTKPFKATIGVNQLANRGDGTGYRVRIFSTSAGKTEERRITGNTEGTAISFRVDKPFSFTPAANDICEIIGGRILQFSNGATSNAGFCVSTDLLTKTSSEEYSAVMISPTISVGTALVVLDEQYVPSDKLPGEGFRGLIEASATGTASITSKSDTNDSDVLVNEYRNFQIRIVEDLTTPTAVGQRIHIASHTAGPSVVYTLGANWTVQPSSNAKFVIEYPNVILMWIGGYTTTFNLNYMPMLGAPGVMNMWTYNYYGACVNSPGAGFMTFPSFGLTKENLNNQARHGNIYRFRGGSSTYLEVFKLSDMHSTLRGKNYPVDYNYIGYGVNVNVGGCGIYCPYNGGRYGYFLPYYTSNDIFRFDIVNGVAEPFCRVATPLGGTAMDSKMLATTAYFDDKNQKTIPFLIHNRTNLVYTQEDPQPTNSGGNPGYGPSFFRFPILE